MKLLKLIIIQIVLVFSCSIVFTPSILAKNDDSSAKNKVKQGTADHSKFKILKNKFKNGKELTDACLSCHNLADIQFRKTIHWTWAAESDDGKHLYGKGKDTFNNFCISTNGGQDKSCNDCHAGWGREHDDVNCLNCHTTSSYNFEETLSDIKSFLNDGDEESIEMAGDLQDELSSELKDISLPKRKNCGSCHFYGGGGDGVKHGDLDSSLASPDKKLDVHMGGAGFECVRCHTTESHNIAGRIYHKSAANNRKSLVDDDRLSKITCESCHTLTPHIDNSKLNDHTDVVACQTCHIPSFARENPTKMEWDWSKAGMLKDGKPFATEDKFGEHDYLSIKGKFRWDKNVVPEYAWFNGAMESLTSEDVINPKESPIVINKPCGNSDDKVSRIFPFKVHRGKQPYDTESKKFLLPLLSDEDGYWKTFDWDKSFKLGAELSGKSYSGHYDFINTMNYLPINHMVAPKEDALSCIECHNPQDNRLAAISGLYLPGRDTFEKIDFIGWAVIFISFAGVFLHGLGRAVLRNNKKGRN